MNSITHRWWHALRILRSQGLCKEATHHVSVIIDKLLYAVSAWWGCAFAADRQRLQALLQRGIRSGLCSPETPNITESIDDALFQHNPYHVLHHLLPKRSEVESVSQENCKIFSFHTKGKTSRPSQQQCLKTGAGLAYMGRRTRGRVHTWQCLIGSHATSSRLAMIDICLHVWHALSSRTQSNGLMGV